MPEGGRKAQDGQRSIRLVNPNYHNPFKPSRKSLSARAFRVFVVIVRQHPPHFALLVKLQQLRRAEAFDEGEPSLVNSHLTVLNYRLDRRVIGDITLQEIRMRRERIQECFDGVEKQVAYCKV